LSYLRRIQKGERLIRVPEIPDFYWELITKCWNQDPIKRPYFGEIVEELRKHRSEYAFWEGIDLSELEEYENRILSAGDDVDWAAYQRRIEERKQRRRDLQKGGEICATRSEKGYLIRFTLRHENDFGFAKDSEMVTEVSQLRLDDFVNEVRKIIDNMELNILVYQNGECLEDSDEIEIEGHVDVYPTIYVKSPLGGTKVVPSFSDNPEGNVGDLIKACLGIKDWKWSSNMSMRLEPSGEDLDVSQKLSEVSKICRGIIYVTVSFVFFFNGKEVWREVNHEKRVSEVMREIEEKLKRDGNNEDHYLNLGDKFDFGYKGKLRHYGVQNLQIESVKIQEFTFLGIIEGRLTISLPINCKVGDVLTELLKDERFRKYCDVNIRYEGFKIKKDDFLAENCNPNSIRTFELVTKRKYVIKSVREDDNINFEEEIVDSMKIIDCEKLIQSKCEGKIIKLRRDAKDVVAKEYLDCVIVVHVVEFRFQFENSDELILVRDFGPKTTVSDVLSRFKATYLWYKGEQYERNVSISSIPFEESNHESILLKVDEIRGVMLYGNDEFEFVGDLDKTGSSEVFECRHKSTGERVAVKKLPEYELDDEKQEEFEKEVKLIAAMQHPGIVAILGYTKGIFRKGELYENTCIVMKFHENGNLYKVLYPRKGSHIEGWNDTCKAKCVFGIAAIMRYIHAKSVLHRDLKLENILLNSDFEPVIDCLCLREFLHGDLMDSFSGRNLIYVPPQFGYEGAEEEYSFESDVFAYGVILREILTNDCVFDDGSPMGRIRQTYMNKIKSGRRLRRVSGIPDFYWNLIERCWSGNMDERPYFGEIVKELMENREKYAFWDGINLNEVKEYENRILSAGSDVNWRAYEDLIEKRKQDQSLKVGVCCYLHNDFHKGNELGGGGYGHVYSAVHKRTSKFVAMKQLSERQMDEGLFRKEVMIMNSFRHPGIIVVHGYINSVELDNESVLPRCIIMEKHRNGNLGNAIFGERAGRVLANWNATCKAKCVFGIAAIMRYIHAKNIIHRDLKLENVLLSENLEPIICDFGIANLVSDWVAKTVGIGTVQYMAPELNQGLDNENYEPYGCEVDVFAYGVLIYGFFSRNFILEGEKATLKDLAFLNKVKQGKRFRQPPCEVMPKFYWNLVTRCWSQKPIERPYFGEIVEELRKHRKEYAFWRGVDLEKVQEYENRILSAGDEVDWASYERKIEERKRERESLE
jgi:serine/threonine protein kinase